MKLTDSKIKIDIETAGVKKCKKCEEEYPATLGYFYQAKGNVGGLTHICKRCSDNKQYRKRIEDLRSLENVKEVEQRIKEKDKRIEELQHENDKVMMCQIRNSDSEKLEKSEKQLNQLFRNFIALLICFAVVTIAYFFKQ